MPRVRRFTSYYSRPNPVLRMKETIMKLKAQQLLILILTASMAGQIISVRGAETRAKARTSQASDDERLAGL